MSAHPPSAWLAIARRLVAPHQREEAEGDLLEFWGRAVERGVRWPALAFWREALSLAIASRRRKRSLIEGPERDRDRTRLGHLRASLRTALEQAVSDVVVACRRLRAAPVFTTFAVASLALGVGATTAVYSAVASIDLNPLHVRDPVRAAFVSVVNPSSRIRWNSAVSRRDFEQLRAAIAAPLVGSAPVVRTVADATMSDVVAGEAVTGPYFEILGASAVRGRFLQPADDRAEAPAVVVVSDSFWRNVLGADAAVVGHVLRLAGRPFEIVGVVDDESVGLSDRIGQPARFWIPLAAAPPPPGGSAGSLDRPEMTAFTRVETPADIRGLAEAVAVLGASLDRTAPLQPPWAPRTGGRGWTMLSARELDSDRMLPFTLAIVALVTLVLVIASTNLANLVMGRGAERAWEFDVRRALGATRGRLLRASLTESAVLAAAGAIGAYIVVRVLSVVLVFDLPVSRAMVVRVQPHLNLSVLLVSIGATLVSLLVFGVGPALKLSRSGVSRGGSTMTRDWRARRRLIVWQVAISTGLILLAVAATRGSLSQTRRDMGIDVNRLAVGIVNFRAQPWTEATARPAVDAIVRSVRQQRGVEAAAVSSGVPFGMSITPIASITTPDRPFTPSRQGSPYAYLLTATPEIFRVLDLAILRGRSFDDRDQRGRPSVAVLSQVAAAQLFGAADPVGRTVLLRNYINMVDQHTVSDLLVIGVVQDTDTGTVFPDRRAGTVYVPFAQHYEPTLTLVARTSGDPNLLVTRLRNAVRAADPDLALGQAGSGVIMLAPQRVMLRVAAALTVTLAALGILFAMAGLSGVLLQLVSSRRREMGLRAALGALPGQLLRGVIGDGLRPVLWGLAIGLVCGTIVRGVLRSRSSDIALVDVWSTVAVPLLLVGAALLACYAPARRASRVDPNVALRDL